MNMKNNICFVALKKKKSQKGTLISIICYRERAGEKIGEMKLNIYLEILVIRI